MKSLIVLLFSLFSFVAISQEDSTSVTKDTVTTEQQYYIQKADKIDTVSVTFIHIGDTTEPTVILYNDRVRVLFTVEQVQDINNNYRMIELMEEVIAKYGIEDSVDIGIVSSLEKEIYVLNDKVDILNGRILDKDNTISKLETALEKLEEKDSKSDEVISGKDSEIEVLEKEVRKQKIQKKAISIGALAIIVLIVLLAI